MKKTCCCCISTILFIIIAVVAVFFGGTWFAYDKYGKAYCGISYGEVLGLVPGLYNAKEKNIVTNPFDAGSDLASFETKMKKAMFVSEDSNFSIKELLNQLLAKDGGEASEETPSEQEQQLVNQADNAFLDLLKDLNFDFSSLKDFDLLDEQNKLSKGVLSATDKEIASLFSAAFSAVLDNSLQLGVTTEPLSNYVGIKQVVISGADDGAAKEDLRLTATIKIDIKGTLKDILSKAGMNSFVNSLASAVVPKSLFISMEIAPFATEVLPKLEVNSYSDKNNELLFTMIKNIVNKVGDNENKFDDLFNKVDGYIKDVFAKVTNMVDMKFVGDSAELDAIYTIMSFMKLNVEKNDFLQMISYLKCADQDAMDALGNMTYEKAELGLFVTDFKSGYAVSDSLDINEDNFIDKIGQVPNNLDVSKLDLDKPNSELQTIMKYDAMIALMEQQLKGSNQTSPMSTTTDLLSYIKLKNMSFVEDREIEERIRIIMEFDIVGMLGVAIYDNQTTLNFAKQFLPEKIYFTFEISLNGELVPDLVDGKEQLDENGNVIMKLKYPADAVILVNNLNIDQSEKLLSTIKALATSVGGESLGEQLDVDAIKLKLSTTISQAITKLENQAKGKLEIMFTKEGLKLPTVYELIQSMFNLSSQSFQHDEIPDQVRLTIKGVQDEAKQEHGTYLKYQSNAVDNGGKLLADYKEITQDTLKGYSIINQGEKQYFFEGSAMLNVYDKYINQYLSQPFTAGGATVSVKQTLFVDTLTAEQSHIMTEPYYRDLVSNTSFNGKLIIQTADVNIQNLVTVKNPLIPDSLHITYIYNTSANSEQERELSFMVNNLSENHTALIEQIISNVWNKPFTFEEIINQALEQSLAKDIEINLPALAIPIKYDVAEQTINLTATVKPLVLKFSIEDLIKNSAIDYMQYDTEEFKKGTAMLSLEKTENVQVLFDDNLGELEQMVIDSIFKPKEPEIV